MILILRPGACTVFRRHRRHRIWTHGGRRGRANTSGAPRWNKRFKHSIRRAVRRTPAVLDWSAVKPRCTNFSSGIPRPAVASPGTRAAAPCRSFSGIDGGSTSTKAVCLSRDRRRTGQRLSPFAGATPLRTPLPCCRSSANPSRQRNVQAGNSRRGHHRLLARSAAARLPRRRRAGGNRGPRQVRPAGSAPRSTPSSTWADRTSRSSS